MAVEWHWDHFGGRNRTAGSAGGNALGDSGLSVAELVAREITQNSDDAMDRFRFDAAVRDDHEPRLIYKFESIVGHRKSELVKTLDLENLRQHLTEVTSRLGGKRVVEDSCLSSLADPDEPLRLLYAIEYGAMGLEGNPHTHPETSRLVFSR